MTSFRAAAATVGAKVTEWKDLPASAQTIIDAVRAGDVEFEQVMSAIEEGYDSTDVSFSVGDVQSKAGSNLGSAKIFSFGVLAGLSKEETLCLFGQFYRDVVATPDGDDHPNIRAFMKGGWEGVSFPNGLMLSPKAASTRSRPAPLAAPAPPQPTRPARVPRPWPTAPTTMRRSTQTQV